MHLLGATEDAVRFTKLVKRGRRRLVRHGVTGRVAGVWTEFPQAFENAFQEVIHDERGIAEETTRPRGVVNAKGELIPCASVQLADRHFVPVIFLAPAPVIRWKCAALADLLAIHPNFMRASEV